MAHRIILANPLSKWYSNNVDWLIASMSFLLIFSWFLDRVKELTVWLQLHLSFERNVLMTISVSALTSDVAFASYKVPIIRWSRLSLKEVLLQCWSIARVTFSKRACIISTGNKAGNLIKREPASVDAYEKQEHTERTKDRSLSDLEITHILIIGQILVNVNRTAPTS